MSASGARNHKKPFWPLKIWSNTFLNGLFNLIWKQNYEEEENWMVSKVWKNIIMINYIFRLIFTFYCFTSTIFNILFVFTFSKQSLIPMFDIVTSGLSIIFHKFLTLLGESTTEPNILHAFKLFPKYILGMALEWVLGIISITAKRNYFFYAEKESPLFM